MPFLDKKPPAHSPALHCNLNEALDVDLLMQFGTLTSLRVVQGIIWMMLDNFTAALPFLSDKISF